MSFLGLGTGELILILAVLLLFFGKEKLPDLARSIGKSFRELKSGFEKPTDETEKPAHRTKEPSNTDTRQQP